jgi:membrane protein DedA with SNARE-associated domain
MSSEWILNAIDKGGYLAVFLLMLGENVFPPIPSEVVMPVSGISASSGSMSIVGVIIAGTAGAVAGQSLWYWLGAKLCAPRLKQWAARHGRWLTMSPRDIDHVTKWFEEHGGKAVLLGRLVPGIRTFISLPAGIAGMKWPRFLLYSTIGSGAWTAALAVAGYMLHERYENITRYIGPVSMVIFGGLVALYLYRVVTFKPRR